MKLRNIITPAIAATFALSGAAAADEAPAKHWKGYSSSVTRNVEIDVDRTTEIDASKRLELDKSQNTHGSYNTDERRRIDGSFNKRLELDKSQTTDRSYNTDVRHRMENSNNRSWDLDVTKKTRIDSQTVTPNVTSRKKNSAVDTQSASNNQHMNGPVQSANQGGFHMAPLYQETTKSREGGYGYRSPRSSFESRKLEQSNEAFIGGHNFGAVSNTNIAGQGDGEMVLGDMIKGSILGSRLGNEQSNIAGPQSQTGINDQRKKSETTAVASDEVTTTTAR